MHHLIETPELATWTVTYAVPSNAGQSRILARFPFRFNDTKPSSTGSRLRRFLFSRVPDWVQHLQQNLVRFESAVKASSPGYFGLIPLPFSGHDKGTRR
jgi:hypothetical protein